MLHSISASTTQVELISAKGRAVSQPWLIEHSVEQIYDQECRTYVFVLSDIGAKKVRKYILRTGMPQSSLEFPSSGRSPRPSSRHAIQSLEGFQYINFHIYLEPGYEFSIELTVLVFRSSASAPRRVRMIISSAFKSFHSNGLHCQIPLDGVDCGEWVNYMIDIWKYVPGSVLSGIRVNSNCRLRRILLSKIPDQMFPQRESSRGDLSVTGRSFPPTPRGRENIPPLPPLTAPADPAPSDRSESPKAPRSREDPRVEFPLRLPLLPRRPVTVDPLTTLPAPRPMEGRQNCQSIREEIDETFRLYTEREGAVDRPPPTTNLIKIGEFLFDPSSGGYYTLKS